MLLVQDYAINQHSEFPRRHISIQQYVEPEPLSSMVDENHLGSEVLSICGTLSALDQKLQPKFGVWYSTSLISLQCAFLGIREKVAKVGFRESYW